MTKEGREQKSWFKIMRSGKINQGVIMGNENCNQFNSIEKKITVTLKLKNQLDVNKNHIFQWAQVTSNNSQDFRNS